MQAHKVVNEVIMPPSEYWVGDPCYAVPNERWMEWLEAADYMNERRFLLAELDGKPVLGINTAHGDGVYRDEQGRSYPVDAGLIGLTPVEIATEEVFGSHKISFAFAVRCTYDDGVISFNNIHINTDD